MQWLSPVASGCLGAAGGALMRFIGGRAHDDASDASLGTRLVSGHLVQLSLIGGYVLSQCLMFTFHNRGLRALPLLHVTVLNLAANAVASTVLGLALFGEAVAAKTVLGLCLLVTGSSLIVRGEGKKAKRA
mmetsp:Transcript_13466/g.37817  ORF Transcript_13466/g.37817 Transcript_13466/m.37817 type:complete len:131 (+) Transcript_13466:405-797(+)